MKLPTAVVDHDSSVNWHYLEFDKHKRDTKSISGLEIGLYGKVSCSPWAGSMITGFEWIDHGNAEQSILFFFFT